MMDIYKYIYNRHYITLPLSKTVIYNLFTSECFGLFFGRCPPEGRAMSRDWPPGHCSPVTAVRLVYAYAPPPSYKSYHQSAV